MRKIRDILRLAWFCNQSRQAIASSCGVGKTTVTDTLYRASAAKLSWPLPVALDGGKGVKSLFLTNTVSLVHQEISLTASKPTRIKEIRQLK